MLKKSLQKEIEKCRFKLRKHPDSERHKYKLQQLEIELKKV